MNIIQTNRTAMSTTIRAMSLIRPQNGVEAGAVHYGPGNSSPAENEELETDTRELIGRFLKEFTGLVQPRRHESKAMSTMKRVVGDLLVKHRYTYKGMINKISLCDRRSHSSLVSAIVKNVFSDGTTDWGRIASLMAFAALVSQYMVETGRGSCVELVGQDISTYLLTDQRDWLIKNNSWDGFVEFFSVADPGSIARNTLMACVGIAGILAMLAFLIRRKFWTPKDCISAIFDLTRRVLKPLAVRLP